MEFQRTIDRLKVRTESVAEPIPYSKVVYNQISDFREGNMTKQPNENISLMKITTTTLLGRLCMRKETIYGGPLTDDQKIEIFKEALAKKELEKEDLVYIYNIINFLKEKSSSPKDTLKDKNINIDNSSINDLIEKVTNLREEAKKQTPKDDYLIQACATLIKGLGEVKLQLAELEASQKLKR